MTIIIGKRGVGLTEQGDNDMDPERYLFISITEPVAWLLAIILTVFIVLQVLLRRDANGRQPELRHFIAWVFAAGAAAMLLDSIVVFNVAVFQGTASYWPSVLLFLGSAVCAGIAAIARYAENPPPKQ